MLVLKIFIVIALALWIGGLSLFIVVVTPLTFRSFPKEDAGRFMGMLFPALDRWALLWGALTGLALFLFLMGRHLAWRSLALEVPVALMFWLTLHSAVIVHPQIRELKRKLNLPEFQKTAHRQTIQYAFNNMHRYSMIMHVAIMILGLVTLGLVPQYLR